jgi:hypothetical protein
VAFSFGFVTLFMTNQPPFFNLLPDNFLPHQPYLRSAAVRNNPEQIQTTAIGTGELRRISP